MLLICLLNRLCVCSVILLCLTLCNSMDCRSPGSSVHGIFQARILEWVAMSSSRGSSWLRDCTPVSCIGRWILCQCTMWEAPYWTELICNQKVNQNDLSRTLSIPVIHNFGVLQRYLLKCPHLFLFPFTKPSVIQIISGEGMPKEYSCIFIYTIP